MAEQVAIARPSAIGYALTGVVVAVAALAILHETVTATVDTWYASNAFNHGFLIIPICLYLGWTRRDALAGLAPRPDVLGVILVVVASAAWLTGHATGTLIIQELSLVAILQGIFLAIYGRAIFQALLFPLCFLYFLVPMGEALIPPLERITGFFSVALLRIIDVPVFSDGNLISVPTGSFYVADACAGLRYLISSLVLGVLFAGLMFRTWWRRAVFLLISMTVPILANGIRAFGIILLAYSTDNAVAVGVDHIIYGWLFFALVTFLVLSFGMTMREHGKMPATTRPQRTAPAPFTAMAAAALIALLPIAAAKAYGDYIERPPVPRRIELAMPTLVGSFHQLTEARDPAPPSLEAPDAQAEAAYDVGGRTIYLHVGYYQRERQGAEAAGSGHHLSGKDWFVTRVGAATASVGADESSVQVQEVASGKQRRLIWYWYWVDGRFTGNPYLAKLLQAKVKLIGGWQPSAVIVTAVDFDDTPAAASRALRQFAAGLTALVPALRSAGRD